MQKVCSKDKRCTGRHPGASKQFFYQYIEDGQHHHADQRSRKPPAERRHPEKQDPKGQDQLSQRRMGDLVGVDVVQVFPCSAGVIDLVKVCGIQVTVSGGDETLFISKLRCTAGEGNLPPVEREKGDLAQPASPRSGQKDGIGTKFRRRPDDCPAQHVPCILCEGSHGDVTVSLKIRFKRVCAVPDACKHNDTGDRLLFRKREDDRLFPNGEKRLHRSPVAKPIKIHKTEQKRDTAHHQNIDPMDRSAAAFSAAFLIGEVDGSQIQRWEPKEKQQQKNARCRRQDIPAHFSTSCSSRTSARI